MGRKSGFCCTANGIASTASYSPFAAISFMCLLSGILHAKAWPKNARMTKSTPTRCTIVYTLPDDNEWFLRLEKRYRLPNARVVHGLLSSVAKAEDDEPGASTRRPGSV